jgi:putative ABC transport system ATP-binding protein
LVGNETDDAEQGPASPAARAVDLTKTYGKGDGVVRALAGVDVEFERGRFTAVMGPSPAR